MKKILLGLLALCVLVNFADGDAVADEKTFRCRVKNVYELTDDGQLIKNKIHFYRDSSFRVKKSSGRIIGGAFDNKGDYQMKVVAGGSYKVFSFADSRGVAESVAIRTWQEGKIKSFIGIDFLQTVLTGVCD